MKTFFDKRIVSGSALENKKIKIFDLSNSELKPVISRSPNRGFDMLLALMIISWFVSRYIYDAYAMHFCEYLISIVD